MNNADTLIDQLNLVPHPEGGFYRELHRSSHKVSSAALKGDRSAYTSIYYLLRENDFSAWHRITSDETWFFHAGSDLCIHTIETDQSVKSRFIGPSSACAFQLTIPANTWFAAELSDKQSYCLVSCVVAPGFEFTDFELGNKTDLYALAGQNTKTLQFIESLTRY